MWKQPSSSDDDCRGWQGWPPLGDIEPLLPDRTPKRGGRWRNHREVIDAIAFKFQTGTQWVHLPEKYGNWRGVYNRLRMWAIDGTWERVFTALKKGPRPASPTTMPSAGRVGGLTTKIHLAADGRCRPLAFHLTPGQAGDAPAFTEIMARLRVPRPRGRPRTRPDLVLADKTSHADKRQTAAAWTSAGACGKAIASL
ncbi:transposase [Streptomyces sp. NPDC049915]|uniref:transposase n=1 Tax=Streptomyces sp. NPDC049915 TaxID=3155510 RepID=UPI0034262AF2